jgi:F-type H+-transporting ATPase subunit delta
MNLGKLSIRYAQALYSLAEEKNLQDVIFSEMNQLVSSFFQVRELSQAISNPLYASQDKLQLLVNAAGVEISDLLKHFFQFVIDKGRESQILFIAMSYRDIHAKK